MLFQRFILLLSYYRLSVALIVVKPLFNESIEKFEDEDSLFGPRVSDTNPATGYLFTADPIEGCVHKIPLPENASRHAIPFICLIKRGNCTFDEKVRAAELGGYAAAIVFNHIDDSMFPMSSQSMTPVNIPSFMVGLTTGKRFQKQFTNPYENYIIEIYPNHKQFFEIYLIPVLSLLGLLLLGLTCLCIYRWNFHRRRCRRRGLTSRQVARLPVTEFVKGQTPDGACVICLDDYEDGDKLRHLPCGHAYHSKCVDPWLLKNSRSCPICKRQIRSPSASTSRRRRSRRPFFVSFRPFANRRLTNQQRDEQEDHLVSDSDSYGTDNGSTNDLEEDEEHSSYQAVDAAQLPGTSYGTVVSSAGHQVRKHPPQEEIPNESTPLLSPEFQRKPCGLAPSTLVPHSSHSAPPSLKDFEQDPIHVIANTTQLATSSSDLPDFVLRAPQSTPDLSAPITKPQGATQSTVNVVVHLPTESEPDR